MGINPGHNPGTTRITFEEASMNLIEPGIRNLATAKDLLLTPYGLDEALLTRVLGDIFTHRVDYADLYFQTTRSEAWSLEEGIVKSGSFSIDQGVGVRAVAGERTAFAYSDDLSAEAIMQAAAATKAIAKAGGGRQRIKVASSLKGTFGRDLYLPRDPLNSLDATAKVNLLERIEKMARSRDPRITQVMAGLAGEYDVVLVARSDGILAADIRPLVRVSVTVIAEQNGRREVGSSGGGGRYDYHYFSDELLSGYVDEAVRAAFADNLIDQSMCKAGTWEKLIEAAQTAPDDPARFTDEATGYIGDIYESMRWVAWKNEAEDDDDDYEPAPPPMQPVRNPLRNVGTEWTAADTMFALGYYVPSQQEHIDIQFLSNLEGYIWVFPRCGHLSVGICGKGEPAHSLRARLEQYMDEKGISYKGASFYGHMLPSLESPGWKKNRLAGDGWLAVGDAGGLVDPITGEGLYYAMRSGDLASQVVLNDAHSLAEKAQAYCGMLRRDFAADLEFGASLAKRVFLGTFLFSTVPARMIGFVRRSPRFRALIEDLLAGTQPYLGLKSRLFKNLNGSLQDIAMNFVFQKVIPRKT